MSRWLVSLMVIGVTVSAAVPAPTIAGNTELVSVSSGGEQGNATCQEDRRRSAAP